MHTAHFSSPRSATHQLQRSCVIQPRVSRASARRPWVTKPASGKQTHSIATEQDHQQRLPKAPPRQGIAAASKTHDPYPYPIALHVSHQTGLHSPPSQPVRQSVPELVSLPHRDKAKDQGNAHDERPKESRKRCDLSQTEEKAHKTTEHKTTSEAKPLLKGVWTGAVFHQMDVHLCLNTGSTCI